MTMMIDRKMCWYFLGFQGVHDFKNPGLRIFLTFWLEIQFFHTEADKMIIVTSSAALANGAAPPPNGSEAAINVENRSLLLVL